MKGTFRNSGNAITGESSSAILFEDGTLKLYTERELIVDWENGTLSFNNEVVVNWCDGVKLDWYGNVIYKDLSNFNVEVGEILESVLGDYCIKIRSISDVKACYANNYVELRVDFLESRLEQSPLGYMTNLEEDKKEGLGEGSLFENGRLILFKPDTCEDVKEKYDWYKDISNFNVKIGDILKSVSGEYRIEVLWISSQKTDSSGSYVDLKLNFLKNES